ncbi:hypothetical protein E3O19_00535 [Cryobacterium algoritolerans]|uniref:SHOCT domain-containing protein n=1 Tax=Cryobacterium algoritolerans TaxID=1259184 RepID=A0A4R8X2D9_9MICO|nr:hypothetical protein [Cryobacterium algoritolerans]TFC21257.1 hypothetical protein E3O19_00535 [Cryobacterium algoritolerans]
MLSTALLIGLVAHPGPGHGWGGGPIWLLVLIPLFGLGLFALLFALFGRRWRRGMVGPGYLGGPGFHGGPSHWQVGGDTRSAEKTLAERFAQGDIDEVEYRARLEVLRANRADDAATPPQ